MPEQRGGRLFLGDQLWLSDAQVGTLGLSERETLIIWPRSLPPPIFKIPDNGGEPTSIFGPRELFDAANGG